MYSFPGPFADPDVFRYLVQLAGARIRQGAAVFDGYIAELRQMRAAARLAELSPEELNKAKEAWEQALRLSRSAEAPVDIVNEANRVVGRFSNGSHLEIISRSQTLHGGNRIALDAERTTTVTGTMRDVGVVADRGFLMPGATVQGANPGAINILRSPRWSEIRAAHQAILDRGETALYWRTVTDEFWNTVNRPWMEEAIARGDRFRLVSNPADELATFVTDARGNFILDEARQRIRSIFWRELELLRARGYTITAEGLALPPAAP
jgi:hypothetical protein